MREIIIAVILAIIGIAATVMLTALEKVIHLSPLAWNVLFLVSSFAMVLAVVNFVCLIIFTRLPSRKKVTPALLINIGTCLVVAGFVWHFSFLTGGPATPEFSWKWNPLTEKEKQSIVSNLSNVPARRIFLVYDSQNAEELADSFRSVFKELKWEAPQLGGRSTMILPGKTGVGYYPSNETSNLLKRAIENGSSLKLGAMQPENPKPDDQFMLIIGAKPVPSPVPKDLQESAARLVPSGMWLEFGVARSPVT